MSPLRGSLVTETFSFDGGRSATAYVPPGPPGAVVYVADGGWHTERLARAVEASVATPPTMIVGVHGVEDDDVRLLEYVEGFGGERFKAFERFFVDEVRAWAASELDTDLAAASTAVWGASLGGELALAVGLRHPEIYGVVLCASPGGGFTPADASLSSETPRTYLVGGTQEQWFLDNARRWAAALGEAGVDVVMEERVGEHGGAFWYEEFPRMLAWLYRN